MPMAMNHGAAARIISGTPQPGRKARNQGAPRSAIARVMPASSGTMGPTGPLSSAAPPSSSQKPAA